MRWLALPVRALQANEAVINPQTTLAWWALQFSPSVARVQDVLVIEVSASERLFGGRTALLDKLLFAGPVVPQRYAKGDTSLVAMARLKVADRDGWAPEIPADALPLHALHAALPHLPTLLRLGCQNWGHLRALPRAGVARRFGAELLTALDRAYGQRAELYPWLTLPDVFDEKLELSAAVESATAMLFGANRLLSQLLLWLRARQCGLQDMEFIWELDARRSNARHVDAHHTGDGLGHLMVRTAQPTQDIVHLQRLLGEQLARVTLPAPVLYVRLRSVQIQALPGETRSLLPEDLRTGDRLHHMLERVGARIGPGSVLCVQMVADHVPERRQQWRAWSKADAGRPATPPPKSDGSCVAPPSPSWLLDPPRRLHVSRGELQYLGTLAMLAGPMRLEGGWLQEQPVLRDYYLAHSPGAGLVWIFKERLRSGEHWYLHGLFA